MKHHGIQATASKLNAIKTYRRNIHYVAASPASAIAIYTEKLRGCGIADHVGDVGRKISSGLASGQFAIARLYRRKVRVRICKLHGVRLKLPSSNNRRIHGFET